MTYFPHFNPLVSYFHQNSQPNQVFYGNNYGSYYGFPTFLCNNQYLMNADEQNLVQVKVKQQFIPQNHFQTKKNESQFQKEKANDISQEPQSQMIYLQNRNVLPNNVSFLISHIRRINKSGKLVEKIIKKHADGKKADLVKRFFAYQTYLKENCTDYISNNAIGIIAQHIDENCPVFTIEEQVFYNKVTRILISAYIRQNCLLEVLGLGKVKKSSIPDHLKVHRYLQEVLKSPKNCKFVIKYR